MQRTNAGCCYYQARAGEQGNTFCRKNIFLEIARASLQFFLFLKSCKIIIPVKNEESGLEIAAGYPRFLT